MSVLIVGASFSGLYLAQLLEKKYDVDYVIVERYSEPVNMYGPVTIPNWRQYLEDVGILGDKLPPRDNEHSVDRYAFLDTLRQACGNKIHWNATVVKVNLQGVKYYATMEREVLGLPEPFAVVVAATGLTSPMLQHTYVLGDARQGWSWWDVSLMQRRRCGAQRALRDAVVLARLLSVHLRSRRSGGQKHGYDDPTRLSEFRIQHIIAESQRRSLRIRRVLIGASLCLAAACFLR